MSKRLAQRLLIVGWDAADWQIIDPLIARGDLPCLAGLIRHGVRSDLSTLEPRLSPLLWTSIATGRTPDVHGITNFVEPKPDGSGLRVSSSTSRKVKALWNIASQSGMTANVTGWYASHPAEGIRGAVTSNLLMEGDPADGGAWPVAPGTVHPASLTDAIAAQRVGRVAFRREHLPAMLPSLPPVMASDPRIGTLCKLMAVAASVERAARVAMQSGRWDLSMVFFETIDTVGHHFMQYRPPRQKHVSEGDVRTLGGVMDAVYRWHDAALGRLLGECGSDTTVLLISDHGFHSGQGRPNLADLPAERRMEKEASWHRPIGVLVASGPGIRPGAVPAVANILDVAPTALALLGLPSGQDFNGRVLAEILDGPAPELIASWEGVAGDAGLHPDDARQDPYEAADAIQQLVDLGYMAALPDDAKGQVDLVKRESWFNVGVHLLSRGLVRQALPHFEALHAARPEEVRYTACLVSSLIGCGEVQRAIEVTEQWLKRDPSHVEARLMLARALEMDGRGAEARVELDRVIKSARSAPELLLPIADALLRQGRPQESLAFARKAHEADRGALAPLLAIARAHLGLQQWEHAAERALEALARALASAEGHLLLALALAWSGDVDNAVRSVEYGMQFDGGHLPTLRVAAVLAAAQGAADRARQLVIRANEGAQRIEHCELAPLPFEWKALAAHLRVDQDLLR